MPDGKSCVARRLGATGRITRKSRAVVIRRCAGCSTGYRACLYGLYSQAFHRIRTSSQPMEIQPILNTIKDLTERSQSIRGYL